MAIRITAIASAWLTAALLATTTTASSSPTPDVTIIGDSVMTGVLWHPDAVSVAQAGLRVRWEVAVCRAVAGRSCPFDGSRPPTLVDVVRADGAGIGRTVVVEAGYNDPLASFPQEVDTAVHSLLAAGVERILWVNLHQALPKLTAMNGVLEAAAARYPGLSIVDWNGAAQRHDSWFQTDSIHLTAAGGMGLAELVHAAVLRALAPPLVVVREALPTARVGHPYAARLRVAGGRAPYSWRAVSGPLPRGLHLRPDGRIDGTPRRAGRMSVVLRAIDADGVTIAERRQIRVAPA